MFRLGSFLALVIIVLLSFAPAMADTHDEVTQVLSELEKKLNKLEELVAVSVGTENKDLVDAQEISTESQ